MTADLDDGMYPTHPRGSPDSDACAKRPKEGLSPDPPGIDRFADALVRLLADWWRRHGDEPPGER